MISNANAMDKTCMHFINLTKIVLRSACLEAQKGEMRWKREKLQLTATFYTNFIPQTSSFKAWFKLHLQSESHKLQLTNFVFFPNLVLQTSSSKLCLANFVSQTLF